jgi:predicted nucleotide-binding protein
MKRLPSLSVKNLEDDLGDFAPASSPTQSVPAAASLARKVFIVHGHAGEPREAVARFLDRMDLEPIILHEQANQGNTIIEKFETHADVGFAIVLLTPDDFGGACGGAQHPRARQNVILDLGYFIGRLKRGRVCALKAGDIELPSDILGVVWTAYDVGGAWKIALAKELQAAGYEIDWNKVMT